jgi:hypothetical protein
MSQTENPKTELERILASARRLGVEMDEEEALQWLTAMASQAKGPPTEITIDFSSGVFGHKVVMLDFSPQDLERFREIGQLVGFADQPGVVETALALSGSSAQSKIQSYPGDCDYFERVNIRAATRADACRILAAIMREKALSTLSGSWYQLIEVKFGSYPESVVRNGAPMKAGSPVSWKPLEIKQGGIAVEKGDGAPLTLTWEAVSDQPGWCKLDWVVADQGRGQLANASNMLDVTWEAPDGTITPLDGYLDPYFQEVYLEAESIPLFSKLARHVSGDALDNYVGQLENEVRKYLVKDPHNYGKAAKRMYNIFRLTGKFEEAAYLRELFDEPTTILYQVWSLIRTIDDCYVPGSTITQSTVLRQADELILSVTRALEGEKEAEIIRLLLRLRDQLSRNDPGQPLTPQAEAARAEVINLVNNFFYEKLTAVPGIKAYMDGFAP